METTGLSHDAQPCVAVVLVEKKHYVFCDDAIMSKEALGGLVDLLTTLSGIVTFNGAGYDFKVLHLALLKNKMTEQAEAIRKLAVGNLHVDIMFDFTAISGYYSSMDSFATASVEGCSKSNTGAWAASGRR